MAGTSKKAQQENAYLTLIDETGLFLNPVVRRSWSEKGQTPIMSGDGGRRKKVSIIGALTISPHNRTLNLHYSELIDDFFTGFEVTKFLKSLLRKIPAKIYVVWDGGSNHTGPEIRELLASQKRIQLERLPAYAPELNPVEIIWSWLKYGKLANFVPKNLAELNQTINKHLNELLGDRVLLRSLWSGSKLPFPDHQIV